MLKSLGEMTAREIQNHRAQGWVDEYRADKRAFLLHPRRVTVGRSVEAAAASVVEQIAMDAGLSVLRNVALQFLDAAGQPVGGLQHELDFVIMSTDRVAEIVSAKMDPAQLAVRGDRDKLAHMRDLPSNPQQPQEYAKQHFLGRGSYAESPWSRVVEAAIVFNDRGQPDRMSIQAFHSRYLTKTAVEVLQVRSISPSQPTGAPQPNIALRATTNELLDQLIKFIDGHLA
jgi:hypothetical protein